MREVVKLGLEGRRAEGFVGDTFGVLLRLFAPPAGEQLVPVGLLIAKVVDGLLHGGIDRSIHVKVGPLARHQAVDVGRGAAGVDHGQGVRLDLVAHLRLVDSAAVADRILVGADLRDRTGVGS